MPNAQCPIPNSQFCLDRILESRYRQIRQRVEAQSDFATEELAKSRALFDLKLARPIPRRFEVWTCLAGMPVPQHLAGNLQEIAAAIASLLPPGVRFYQVIPANYHWELFIIKRSAEEVARAKLELAGEILREVLSQQQPLTLSYRGFLITPDGTVLAQGYVEGAEIDSLRQKLRSAIPFASAQQSQLCHISLGRILDSVGSESFHQLQDMMRDSQDRFYGDFAIGEVKYVHETQWYMEEREVIETLSLGG